MAKILPRITDTIFTDDVTFQRKMTPRFISISKAAKFLQVSPDTLRNWEREGKLLPSRTQGGARRYSSADLSILRKEIHPFASRKKGLVSISQAAKALHVSSDTLRNWDKKGLVEIQRSKGGARRFTRDEINRLQKELGVEAAVVARPLLLTAPKSGNEVHNFSYSWLRFSFLVVLVILFVGTSWFVGSYISPFEKKIDETSKIVADIVKSVESLQRGVLGIQTQSALKPEIPLSNSNVVSANPNDGVVLIATETPLTLNSLGQVGCASCLTKDSSYISALNNSDGTLGLVFDSKTVTISLNTDHVNTWSASQIFRGGIGIGTENNPVVMTSGGNVGIGVTSPVNKLVVAGAQTIGIDYAGYGAPVNGLLVQGNVGIGISAPSYRLDVAGGARFGCGDADWNDGPSTNCSDVAEVYQSDGSIDIGEIVALSKQANIVTRSGSAYQKNIIGVYSKSPGLLIGGQAVLGGSNSLTNNQIPVALVGRVPVKVSDENGSIQVGDYLTSSSTPGVAMKAVKPGPVIGQALEPIDFFTGEVGSQDTHLVDIKVKFGMILVFVNVSYADPGNFMAAMTMDDQGNLIIPKLKTGSIVLEPYIATASSQLAVNNDQLVINTDPKYVPVGPQLASNSNNFIDLSGEIASLEDRIKNDDLRFKNLEAEIMNLKSLIVNQANTGNVGIGMTVISPLPSASSSATPSLSDTPINRSADILELTPPDILLATSSAVLSDVKVTGTLSSDKLFTAQDGKISGDLNVFGKTMLASTTIAGDLTVDGTLSVNGNSMNVIGSPVCSEAKNDCGILYIQNSSLAYQVNFFNGLVTIDKTGNLRAQTVTVAAFKVVANKISGSGKITAGTKSVDIENAQVEANSRILITPNSETNLVLAVTNKTEGKKFTVSTAQQASEDIVFDWFLVNESPN